jgi:hypothetical protein
MKLIIEMTVQAADYGGKEFMEEIRHLIVDIDPAATLTRFKMRQVGPKAETDERAIDWNLDDEIV